MNTVRFVFKTRLGWIGISAADKGLKQLNLPVGSFTEACRLVGLSTRCGNNPPAAFAGIIERIKLYLSGDRVDFTDEIDLSGATEFRRNVWETNRLIPYGETRGYSWVAGQIGSPRAARAVGQALGNNPVPIVIPCHRVLAKDGGIGGYRGGIELKRYLLRLEATSR